MKKYVLCILLLCYLNNIYAQADPDVLTIAKCYKLAEAHYPLVKKRDLLHKSSDFTIANIAKGYLPRFDLAGQATYQSEVTKVPLDVPGLNIPELNKDQYKLYAEINQLLYDGGMIRQQKELAAAQSKVQKQQLEVELYQIKEKIADLFFAILIFNQQLHQTELLKQDIKLGMNTVEAQLRNGAAYRSSADLLKAEYLKADQQRITLISYRKAYLDMLSLFINQEINIDTKFELPPVHSGSPDIARPELTFYNYRSEYLRLNKKSISAGNRPKFNFFFQGGIGNPALNFLKEAFEPYYVGGIRLTWSFTGFYTARNQQQIVDIERLQLEADKETFLFNTRQSLKRQDAEVEKLTQYLLSDKEIIRLRNNVKEAAKAQLENGVISPADYLREVNAENQAVQNKIIHEIELSLAQYKLNLIRGN